MLHRGAVHRGAQLLHQGLALLAFGALDLDLDELVRLQGALDLGEDGWREAVAGDGHDGVQVVGAGAKVAALGRGKLGHCKSLDG